MGGAPHPDYLLGFDTLDNFRARGLTARQWVEWQVYLRHFPTPQGRADINSALERDLAIRLTPGAKPPKQWQKLIPEYGKSRKKLTDEQIEEVLTWVN